MSDFSNATPEQKNDYIRSINQRWGQLHTYENKWIDNIAKYLFAINTGGAVAILTYLGATACTPTKNTTGPVWSLFFFILGIISVGLFSARMFYVFEGIFKHWRNDTKAFFEGTLNWHELHKRDDKRSESCCIDYILPWSAFLAWILGVGVGLYNFLSA